MASLPTLAWACAWPPAWGVIWVRLFRFRAAPSPLRFYEAWICGALGGVLSYGVARDLVPLVISVLQVVLAAFLWWLSRRRRKRAPKLAGYKGRALLAALVRKAREAVKPRPVLRPVPGRV